MKRTVLMALLSVVAGASIAADPGLSGYDVENRVDFEQFTFLPIAGSDRQGVFLYSAYNKLLLGPTDAGFGWRAVVIGLLPSAITTAEFDDFVRSNNIVDTRDSLIPPDSEMCVLTENVEKMLSELNVTYFTDLLIGGYPKPCSLVIKYFASAHGQAEAAVLDLLQGQDVIGLAYTVRTADTETILDFHQIVTELKQLGVLTETEDRTFVGAEADVISSAPFLSPTLFGAPSDTSDIPTHAWDAFIDTFSVNDDDILSVVLTDDNEVLSIQNEGSEVFVVDTVL